MNRRAFIRATVVVPVVAVFGTPRELPVFTHGGRYLNFGRGAPVMLHGRERVVPYDVEKFNRAVAKAITGLDKFDQAIAAIDRHMEALMQAQARRRVLYERVAELRLVAV